MILDPDFEALIQAFIKGKNFYSVFKASIFTVGRYYLTSESPFELTEINNVLPATTCLNHNFPEGGKKSCLFDLQFILVKYSERMLYRH